MFERSFESEERRMEPTSVEQRQTRQLPILTQGTRTTTPQVVHQGRRNVPRQALTHSRYLWDVPSGEKMIITNVILNII